MAITRTIPEIKSTDIDKTARFYTELIGFKASTEGGRLRSFVSASHAGVEVIVNGNDYTLPPGFTIEVATEQALTHLLDRAPSWGVRVIESIRDDRFTVLDPAGRRVTIAAAGAPQRPPEADSTRTVARAIPGSVIGAPAARAFYGDFLGLTVHGEWSAPQAILFESATSPGAQILTGDSLTSPDSFDLDVGTCDRLDAIYRAAAGQARVLGEPTNFPDHGVRCFLLIDPNGIAINVVAPLPAVSPSA